jgi:hypothetical protein
VGSWVCQRPASQGWLSTVQDTITRLTVVC